MSEAGERLPAGPRGRQGAQGERGARGLPRLQGRAVVVLFLIAALLGVSNWYWTAHEISGNNRQFCAVITGVTSVPESRPADPAKNPSRVTSYEHYERFLQLGRSLGCRGMP